MRLWIIALAAGAVPVQFAPVEAQIMVVSSAVQEREASPGESYRTGIRLRNTSTETVEVRIYQTGYLFYADGRSLHVPPDSQPRSNAAWLRGMPTSLVVSAGEEADVSFTVAVPAAGVAGTYWSMIMIEPITGGAGSSDAAGPPAVGIRTVMRFGIQIATHVAGDAPHRLEVANARVINGNTGKPELEFELINNGSAGYRPNVSVEIFDAQGVAVATFEEQRGLIYPGLSVVQRFALAELPAGEYEALVVVDTSGREVFGAQFRLGLGIPR